jgi:hypothetical protein
MTLAAYQAFLDVQVLLKTIVKKISSEKFITILQNVTYPSKAALFNSDELH